QSLQIVRELDNRAGTAATLNNIASIYDDQEQFEQAIDTYEQALSLVRSGDRSGEATTLSNIGASLISLQRYAEDERTLRAAIDLLDAMRPGLSDTEKVNIFETQAATYRLLQFALAEQNKVELALEIAERSRARAFVDLLTTRLAADTTTPIEAAAPDIATIQQTAIDRNATLVEYTLICNDRLYILVVQPTGEVTLRKVDLQGLAAPIDQVAERTRVAAAIGRGSSLESLVSETRSNLRASESPETRPANRQLQQLHQILIAPIADLLPTDPNASVVFVPQDALFLVPFAALQDANGQYLIQQHTIAIAPAIQALSLTAERSNSSGIDLIVGNPTMPSLSIAPNEPPQPLPGLPGAEQEAKAVGEVLRSPVLIGSQATETAVVAEMPEARIIHLATHGLLDGFEAEATPGAIALAPSENSDGFLNASEILNLNLKADLVVLSACDTGRGRITGDGVIGLSRSLLLAGASSVVVSLWAVPDDATAALMVEFYRQREQQPNKAQALRQAMLTLIDQPQFANPRDWSAFFLIGST
ncbi:MAG: CHAT domain-containing protein, partial [Microcoleus sp. SIO2G3]|nr:CHAT domain-containing protein [Microcoleus sp. SIO2G3]